MPMIVAAAFAVALAALILMFVDALLSYARLPSRVPLRFSARGEPGLLAPKAVFIALFGAIALAMMASLITGASREATHRDTGTIVAAAALVFTAFTQRAIIDAVLNREGRLAVRPLYIALVALIGISMAAARLP